MKPEDRKRLKQHIEMIVEHREPTQTEKILRDAVEEQIRGKLELEDKNRKLRCELYWKSKWRSNFVKAIEEGSTEPDFDAMPIEKINQYLREHGYNPEKVGLRGKILAEALTKNIIAREIIQRFLNNEGGCRFCEYDKYLPLDAPKNGHEEGCLYLAARAYLDNDTSTVVRRDLSDFEIEDLGAQEAESRGDK